MKQEIKRD